MPGRDGPVGWLTLCPGTERGPCTAAGLVTARHVAARAGLVLDNARLHRQQRGLAEGFHRSLLTPPQPDHAQIVLVRTPGTPFVQGDRLGALDLYSRAVGAFDEESQDVGLVFAAHAAEEANRTPVDVPGELADTAAVPGGRRGPG